MCQQKEYAATVRQMAKMAGNINGIRTQILPSDNHRIKEIQELHTHLAIFRGSVWWVRPVVVLTTTQQNALPQNEDNFIDLLLLIVRASGMITMLEEHFQQMLRWQRIVEKWEIIDLVKRGTTRPPIIVADQIRDGEIVCPRFLKNLIVDVCEKAPTKALIGDP